MKKIIFALRASAEKKMGGDSRKAKIYKEKITKLGFSAEIVFSLEQLSLQKPDIVHLFNIDLAYENFLYAEWCVNNSVPYVISTIHHSNEAMSAYYNLAKYNSASDVFKLLGFDFYGAAIFRERLLMLSSGRFFDSLRFSTINLIEMQKFVLDNAIMVFPMADGELKSINNEIIDVTNKSSIIYNPFSFIDQIKNKKTNDDFFSRSGILSVGRIEPRKGQLALIDACENLGVNLTFIGAINKNQKKYVQKFMSKVNNKNIKYIPQIGHDELKNFYRTNRMHVSTSWFEVVSQVDLEAYSQGCKIIPTRYGYAREYFFEKIEEYDPLVDYIDINKLSKKIHDEYEKSFLANIRPEMLTSWDDSVNILFKSYSIIC